MYKDPSFSIRPQGDCFHLLGGAKKVFYFSTYSEEEEGDRGLIHQHNSVQQDFADDEIIKLY